MLVFVVDANFVVKDGVKAHVLEVRNLLYGDAGRRGSFRAESGWRGLIRTSSSQK